MSRWTKAGANGSSNGRPMPREKKCKYCGKSYAMEWARNNHERLCGELKKETN